MKKFVIIISSILLVLILLVCSFWFEKTPVEILYIDRNNMSTEISNFVNERENIEGLYVEELSDASILIYFNVGKEDVYSWLNIEAFITTNF